MSWTETAVGMVGERWPLDLVVITTWAILTAVWAATAVNAVPVVTAVLALPLVVFLPGYVAVSAVFPASRRHSDSTDRGPYGSTGIRPLERGVLSVFSSGFVVPLVALFTNFTSWGIDTATVLFVLSFVTLVGTAAAYLQRACVPPARRCGVVVGDLRRADGPDTATEDRRPAAEVAASLMTGNSPQTTLLNVVLVLAIVAAVGSVAQATVLSDGPGYTETYLLTENESGSLVAAGYPTNFTEGQPTSLIVGVENHRRQSVEYTVVVQLQRVKDGSASAVAESQSVAQFTRTLAPGERALANPTVKPELTGDRLRLVYLVYAGTPPDRPTMANADTEVHLWITVHESESGTNARDCSSECP
jgi:uncharacterized membrane protein